MENSKISTGSRLLDELLEGGFDINSVTTIYGVPASGKTCICMLCAINTAKSNKKVIYVNTEGNFSLERLKQMTNEYEIILNNILIYKPTNFEEQKRFFERLENLINEKIGIIIVDSINKHYRLALAKSYDKQKVNKELGNQLDLLLEISKKKKISFLLTSQVYSDFNEKDKVTIVGRNWLKNRSNCLIELQINNIGYRKAILIKHPSITKQKTVLFKIIKEGIE